MTTDNVQTFRESVEAFNNNNWDRFRALATDDCIIHGSRGDQTIDEYIDGIKERDAIEDSEVQIEDIFGDGDRVTCRYTNTVT
ncbi:MAG: nuclear transport factor 2 family protein, partial [Halobacteriaceae archaeon]